MAGAAMMSGAVAAIGNFDGVHRGHLALIEAARAAARDLCCPNRCCPSAALVFDPHPRRFFRPDDPPFLLTTAAGRDQLLRDAGVDQVLHLPFDERIASLSPEAFVRDILIGRFALKGIVTGTDFQFGKGRAGNSAVLMTLAEQSGLAYRTLQPVHDAGQADKIGSSGIRDLIACGDVARAGSALGRPWRVSGIVETGRQLGRTIDFPTANIDLGELIRPRHGVYAVRVTVAGGVFDAVANFGRRPTVDNGAPRLEVHLFDVTRDLYGQRIDVDFIDFIRGEMKFDGLEALRAQIARDCVTARERLTAGSLAGR